MNTSNEILLATRQADVVEAVSALGLALETEVAHVYDRDALRARWSSARVRLVGPDMASRAAELGAREHTWIVGAEPEQLVVASVELNAPTLSVPDRTGRLAEIMSSAAGTQAGARTLVVAGASGGLGTSSLAVGLALHASRTQPSALVELADCGGGIDLLLGAEAHEGLRWGALAGARGQLGDLTGLVAADGVDVVALEREHPQPPQAEAGHAVIRSLTRSHRAVVVDAGRGEALSWLTPDVVLLLVAADVPGIAAARMAVQHRPAIGGAHLVVRQGPGRHLPPDAVADALGMPLAGTLRHDPMVPRLVADGSSVAAPVARRLTRDVRRLWEVVA